MFVTGVGNGRFCDQYRVCALQVWGSADFVFNIGCVLQVWGSADFVFNIGCVCYRCGDRQLLCLI